jgi:hypothetical protein
LFVALVRGWAEGGSECEWSGGGEEEWLVRDGGGGGGADVWSDGWIADTSEQATLYA